MSFNFGGGSSNRKETQTIALPAASKDEIELRKLNLQFAKDQMARLKQADEEQAAFDASPLAQTQRAIEEKASGNILARLTGEAPVLSPEEQARLDEVFGLSQRRGEESISQFARDMAATRGMSVTDAPIGGDALKQQRELTEGLSAQKAASSLDLGNASADFNTRLAAFQNQLRQQAYQNRLLMASQAPASFGLQGSLFGERLSSAGRSASGRNDMSQWGYGANMGQAGSFMQGLGSMGVGG